MYVYAYGVLLPLLRSSQILPHIQQRVNPASEKSVYHEKLIRGMVRTLYINAD